MNRDDAEEFTQSLGQIVGGSWRQIALAKRMGVPKALGITVESWVNERLGGYIRMNVEDRRKAAEELKANGESTREIASVLGVGHATVARDLAPVSDETEKDVDAGEVVSNETPAPLDAVAALAVTPAASTADPMAVHYSSATPEWSTPQSLFDVLQAEFAFDLDVCATTENAKCARFYTTEQDGLAQEWRGNCWMNPPYGDVIADWVAKAHASATDGTVVVCLVPARVDTGWWWEHARFGEVRFLRGRLRFGNADASAPFPSAVVIFGRPESTRYWEWQ